MKFNQDEFLFFRGTLWVKCWGWHPAGVVDVALTDEDGQVTSVRASRQRSPDLVTHFGDSASHGRFAFTHQVSDSASAAALRLTFVLATGERVAVSDAAMLHLATDPVRLATGQFHEMVRALGAGRVLEVGSRARSGNLYRDWLPDEFAYVGFDYSAGPNVDVIGDAHELSMHLEPNSFDAAYSIATFEHLAMPWRAALELNKVLKPGGLVYVLTPQMWPIHDVPWDFWRFTQYGWAALFNEFTGFEIVRSVMGEPASVIGKQLHDSTVGLEDHPAYLSTSVIARKISDTHLSWDVPIDRILETSYPEV